MQAGSNYTWRISNAPPTTAFSISLNLENTGGLLGVPTWPLPYPLFDLADPSQPSAALVAGGLLWHHGVLSTPAFVSLVKVYERTGQKALEAVHGVAEHRPPEPYICTGWSRPRLGIKPHV